MTALEKIRSHKRLAIGVAAIVFLCAAALLLLADDLRDLFPDEEHIAGELASLKKLQSQMQAELNEQQRMKIAKENLARRGREYWITQRDGKVETDVHKKLEKAAKLSGLTISSMGNIRQTKVSDSVSLMEIDFAASSKMESFSRFLSEIYMSSPRFYWDRCSLRPDNMSKPQNIMINGNLKFVCVNDAGLAEMLAGK